jgi:hypothetical protein
MQHRPEEAAYSSVFLEAACQENTQLSAVQQAAITHGI